MIGVPKLAISRVGQQQEKHGGKEPDVEEAVSQWFSVVSG
jgi:hypothetical protein